MNIIELIKVVFLGIVEGITEWLPISSTGHMLLVDAFMQLKESEAFKEMFFVVIQLGAIMAVVLLFWKRMWPFGLNEKKTPVIKKDIFSMWFKVVVACIPGAVITLAFDDIIEEFLNGTKVFGGKTTLMVIVIALALILYGIAFILVEKWNKKRTPKVNSIEEITYKDALLIGLFQVLSIIPGTSRSGSTIIGGLCIGVSRVAAADFTFFLAVPVMLGYSLLKVAKYFLDGFFFSMAQIWILLVGCLVAFLVSIVVIKFLLSYIKKNDFAVFGWYRIILGIVVLGFFLIF